MGKETMQTSVGKALQTEGNSVQRYWGRSLLGEAKEQEIDE